MPEEFYSDCETITLNEAHKIAHDLGRKVTKATLITWLDSQTPKLYHQPRGVGGKIYVYKSAFLQFITGKEVVDGKIKGNK